MLLSINRTFAQTPETWTRGLRFGCDVSRFALGEFQPGRKAIEFSFDTEIKPNLFSTVELGLETSSKSNNRIIYKSNGYYGRLGIDYNILKRDQVSSDIVYVGARYGYYTINHQTDWYSIPGSHGDTTFGSFSSRNLDGHWFEAVFGVKVSIMKNLFLGTSLRARILLYSKKDINYPQFMPGFGNGAKKATFGLTYSIYYQIPIMKVKMKVKKPEDVSDPKK